QIPSLHEKWPRILQSLKLCRQWYTTSPTAMVARHISASYQANDVLPTSLPQVMPQGPSADMRWPSQVLPRNSSVTASAARRAPQKPARPTNSSRPVVVTPTSELGCVPNAAHRKISA